MKPIIDLTECLQDSPKFRSSIEQNENDIEQLEQKTEKLIKLCNNLVENGKAFISSKNAFISGIWEMVVYFKEDVHIASALSRLTQAITELTKYHSILIDQMQRCVGKNLQNFVKNDIRQVKETKRYFEKIGDDLDNALIRNSQVPRSKPHECDDASTVLTAVRSCFQHTALDYVSQLSCLQSKKSFEILDIMLSLMHAYSTYFHQGWDLFQDVDPFLKHLAGTLTELNDEATDLEKQLEGRHALVSSKDIVPIMTRDENVSNSIKLEGYLFKRTSNAFKTWNRRWFIIQKNQLVYRKRCHDDVPTIMEEDLRLCSVKVASDIDRRFCFEVLSPTKSHMLQSDSEEAYHQWMTSLQEGIDCAINNAPQEDNENKWDGEIMRKSSDSSLNTSEIGAPAKPPRTHSQILSIVGNEICCDCKSPDPRWASINLGITLCIECSGIHRSLGVHVSKVRSLTLDTWEPELFKVMAELGNVIVNSIYEANVSSDSSLRATPDSPRHVREAWIKAKYVKKEFVKPLPCPNSYGSTGEGEKNEEQIDPNIARNTPQRWSVRKIHRRRRTTSFLKNKENTGGGVSILCHKPEEDNNEKQKRDVIVFGANELISQPDIEFDSADESPTFDEMEDTVSEDISKLHPDLLLYRAAAAHNLPVMCEAFAHNANPNWKNDDDNGKFPLHQAVQSGSMMACEYLLLNSAKCNNQDNDGHTVLHVATKLGHTGQVCLLLKRGADQNALDNCGRSSLIIAMEDANADIVTLLRLAKLNEEIRRDEFGNPGDETFNDVVRDFSHMASHNPEKLRRQPVTPE